MGGAGEGAGGAVEREEITETEGEGEGGGGVRGLREESGTVNPGVAFVTVVRLGRGGEGVTLEVGGEEGEGGLGLSLFGEGEHEAVEEETAAKGAEVGMGEESGPEGGGGGVVLDEFGALRNGEGELQGEVRGL